MRVQARWLRRRWYVLVGLWLLIVFAFWLARGAIQDSHERRAVRARIEASATEAKDLAQQVRDQNDVILRIATAIDSATSQEARDRSSAVLAGAIADLRRSIDCANLYGMGLRPAPCADADARLDALRAGIDPFTRPGGPGGP